MKILVACELPEPSLEGLRSLASDVVYQPALSPEALREQIADAGILIVGNLRVGPDAIARGRALQLIVRAEMGPGNVAIEEASTQGIFVTHCAHKHATAVAELGMALLLALDRQVVENTVALREGRWARGEFSRARGLAGAKLGILGYGAVGRLIARRASAFGMRVLAWTPSVQPEDARDPLAEFVAWPRELARQSDAVIAVATDEADGQVYVDADFFANMPSGAYFVHVGHSAAMDESALASAVTQRGIRAGLDVFGSQPAGDVGRVRSRLFELPGVIGTPRIGALTQQARQAIGEEVVRIVRGYLVSGEVISALNICERSPATWQLVVRVRDQVGVFASILDAIRADGINAEEITSRVFTGAKAAWCTIMLNERPSAEALAAIRELRDVLHVELRAVV